MNIQEIKKAQQMANLNTENARAFNSSLKAAIKELTGQKVRVEIINSYKFPNCWVRVHAQTEFTNEFRLKVYDACNKDRSGLINPENVCYGNIRTTYVSAHVPEWQTVFNSNN